MNEFENDFMDLKPELTLEPTLEEPKFEQPIVKQRKIEPEEAQFSQDELKMIEDFSQKIEITNSNAILQYGVGTQKKISDFSQDALNNVRSKDLGEIGEALSEVVNELKTFDGDEEEKKGIFKIFKKAKDKATMLKTQYNDVETNINQMCSMLENHQVQLLKDIAMLDKMYEINKVYFKELNMYILAGKKKLEKINNEEIPALREKAQRTGDPQDAQDLNDLSSFCNRFEKKIYDLQLTRTISQQMAPQIRLIQNNDAVMSEKIQSTIVNTIPLWKSQIVLTLGVAHTASAVKVQREVTDTTNELLKKNAEILKMSTIETAKESERGIVDIETLKATNESLISTLDEILNIQSEGSQKRKDAEVELANIENELKQKLMTLRK